MDIKALKLKRTLLIAAFTSVAGCASSAAPARDVNAEASNMRAETGVTAADPNASVGEQLPFSDENKKSTEAIQQINDNAAALQRVLSALISPPSVAPIPPAAVQGAKPHEDMLKQRPRAVRLDDLTSGPK